MLNKVPDQKRKMPENRKTGDKPKEKGGGWKHKQEKSLMRRGGVIGKEGVFNRSVVQEIGSGGLGVIKKLKGTGSLGGARKGAVLSVQNHSAGCVQQQEEGKKERCHNRQPTRKPEEVVTREKPKKKSASGCMKTWKGKEDEGNEVGVWKGLRCMPSRKLGRTRGGEGELLNKTTWEKSWETLWRNGKKFSRVRAPLRSPPYLCG